MIRKENYAAGVELGKYLGVHNFDGKLVRKERFGTFRCRWNNYNRFFAEVHVRAQTGLICLRIWPKGLQNKVMKLWVK